MSRGLDSTEMGLLELSVVYFLSLLLVAAIGHGRSRYIGLMIFFAQAHLNGMFGQWTWMFQTYYDQWQGWRSVRAAQEQETAAISDEPMTTFGPSAGP